MSQNRTHAVMAQRHEAHDSLDHFPTPLWATRALFEYVIEASGHEVWEPACGCGAMSRAIGEYAPVTSSDVHDYGWGHPVHDFLLPGILPGLDGADWIVTNPPFRLAEQFIERGLEVAERGVCVLVRTVFIEGIGRYERLFRDRPPAIMAQFAERVPMVKGRLDRDVSTATAYCWLVFAKERASSKLMHIPPCRELLTRHGDYPA